MSPSIMDIIAIALVGAFVIKLTKNSTGFMGIVIVAVLFYGIVKAAALGLGWGFTLHSIRDDTAQYVSGVISLFVWFVILVIWPKFRNRKA